jgi:hypothetical protein
MVLRKFFTSDSVDGVTFPPPVLGKITLGMPPFGGLCAHIVTEPAALPSIDFQELA